MNKGKGATTLKPEIRIQALKRGLEYIRAGTSPGVAWEIAGKEVGASKPTMYRWYRKIEKLPEEEWLEALEPGYVPRKTSITDESYQRFLALYADTDPPSIKEAHRLLVEESSEELPGESAYRYYMKRQGDKKRSRYDPT